MKPLRCVVPFLIAATLATDPRAQDRVAPAPSPRPPAPAPTPEWTLQEAIAKLADAGAWPVASKRLVALAKTQQQPVLEAVAPLLRGEAGDLKDRGRVVLDALITQHLATEKREELRRECRRVADAADDLKRALGNGLPETQQKALASLLASLAELRRGIDTDEPLAAKPLRVPTGAPTPSAADAAAPPMDGYREIDVGGKKMLVPADALPEGTDYTAEMTERGLVVKSKRKAKDADKPAGDAKKPVEPKPAVPPEKVPPAPASSKVGG